MNETMRIRSRRLFRASALFAALGILFALCGCAGQQATVTPSVVVEKETLGHNVLVAVKTADARGGAIVGLCNPASKASGKLTVACDPAPAMRSAVERGLRDKGFTIATGSDVVRSVTVELTELSYDANQTGAYLAAKAKAVVAVTVDNNGQTFKHNYTGETTWKLPSEGVEPEFDPLLSTTVSKALSATVSDYELIHFLEKTVLRTRDLK